MFQQLFYMLNFVFYNCTLSVSKHPLMLYPGYDVDKSYYPPFFLNNDITKILTHTHTQEQ